jgi:hypothetical protein
MERLFSDAIFLLKTDREVIMQKGKEIVLEVKELTKQIDRTILVDHLNFSLERGIFVGFRERMESGKLQRSV